MLVWSASCDFSILIFSLVRETESRRITFSEDTSYKLQDEELDVARRDGGAQRVQDGHGEGPRVVPRAKVGEAEREGGIARGREEEGETDKEKEKETENGQVPLHGAAR